jgi:hypothetical protein
MTKSRINGNVMLGGGGGGGGTGAVDSVDGRTGVVTLGDRYVNVTGDAMTGALRISLAVGTTATLTGLRIDASVGPDSQFTGIKVNEPQPSSGTNVQNIGIDIAGQANTAAGENGFCIWARGTNSRSRFDGLIEARRGVRLGVDETAPSWSTGYEAPEGTVAAGVGSLYSDTAGGAGTTLYLKEANTDATGWVAVGGGGGVTWPLTRAGGDAVVMLQDQTEPGFSATAVFPGQVRLYAPNATPVGIGAIGAGFLQITTGVTVGLTGMEGRWLGASTGNPGTPNVGPDGFTAGDFMVDRLGGMWVNTADGPAPTWVEIGAGGGGPVVPDDNSVTSAKIADDTIVNADISPTAAIALSKLATDPLARANHTGTQLAATISDFNAAVAAAAVVPDNSVTSAKIADGTIVNADIAVGAAIDLSKLATNPLDRANHTGTQLAATISDLSAAVAAVGVPDNSITSAKIADGTIANNDIAAGAGIDLSKLAVNPLARANHTGTQLAATISDFNTAVRLNRLDQMAQPTAVVNVNGQTITGLPTPSGAADAVNKTYVDNVAAGLDFKASVRAAATTAVNIAAPGATIDGVTLSAGNRILLTAQATASENGIYVWNGAAVPATRATDADVSAEVTSGLYVFVEQGTANGAKAFVLITPDPITLGTTDLTFTLFSGGGTSVIGTANRIAVTGTQIDIASNYVGQASITTLGTVATGVWNGTPVPITNGGTGATNATDARTNLGITGTGAVVTKSTPTTIGNNSLTSFPITHGLNTTAVLVEIFETATGATVLADVTRTSPNAITVSGFAATPTSNQYTVVVIG